MRENRERLNQIKLESDRAQAQRRHNQERCAELVERSVSSEAELDAGQQRLTTLEAERDSNRQILDSAAADVAAAQEGTGAMPARSRRRGQALAELEQQQEDSRRAIMEAVLPRPICAIRSPKRKSVWRPWIARPTSASRNGDREFSGRGFRRTARTIGPGIRDRLTAGCWLDGGNCSRRGSRSNPSAAKKSEAKSRLDGLRAEYATAIGKKGSLEAVIAEHGYSTESVRRLFQSGVMNGGLAPVGVLADFLEVEPRYEGVVEDFLRDELNYIVVKSWDAADEGLRLLRTDVDGRATFLVHPEDSQAKFSFRGGRSSPRGAAQPVDCPAEACDPRAEWLWPIAGSHSAQAARRLHRS